MKIVNMNFRSFIFSMTVAALICFPSSTAILAQERGAAPELHYYLADSDTARAHTAELRAAQRETLSPEAGEDIVFCLDDGVYVQFSNGSGRRKLIGRGNGYSAFMYPAWSLDGTQIAFSAVRTTKYVVDLIVANADGSSPTVIFTGDVGAYSGFIQSISWSWDSQYLMFTYAYDDIDLFSYFALCTIQKNGTNFSTLSDLTRSYCQYEPVTNSVRYAYISTGTAFDSNSRLRVSNLNGTNDVAWLTFTNSIAAFTHVCWKNASSLYTIVRNWSSYPGKEVLVRVDKTSGGSTWTVLILSDPGASLWSPTLSPDRTKMYLAEMTGTTATLSLSTIASNGTISSIVSKGAGMYPNWRQRVPVTAVEDKDLLAPADFFLAQNYPNPFNPTTTIRFEVPVSGFVTLKIYDVLGQEVATLVNEEQSAGYKSVTWDAANTPTGIYFYKLTVGSFTQTKKLLLMR